MYFCTIISDCRDENALGRMATRVASLFNFNGSITTIGVKNDLEAAGNLADVLDASLTVPGVVFVNVAPRNGNGKMWPNGTPFGYLIYYGGPVVFTTLHGYTLSLLKKLCGLGPKEVCRVFNTETVIQTAHNGGLLDDAAAEQLQTTQFRGLELLPRLAYWVMGRRVPIPYREREWGTFPDAPVGAIWWVDCFGNCKTTWLPEDVNFTVGTKLLTAIGEINCYECLRDVPDGEAGLVIGSSGIGQNRLLELVIQGGSAASTYNLRSGLLLQVT